MRLVQLLILAGCLFGSQVLFAQAGGPGAGGRGRSGDADLYFRVQSLENKLSNLEQRNYDLEYRISRLEDPRSGGGHFPPRRDYKFFCSLTDTGYNKVFLGEGQTKLEAEAKVRQLCGGTVSASYCQGRVNCDSPQDMPPGARGFACMLTDTGYNKVFTSVGDTMVVAEAKTRQACGSVVSASYCVGPIRCEPN